MAVPVNGIVEEQIVTPSWIEPMLLANTNEMIGALHHRLSQ